MLIVVVIVVVILIFVAQKYCGLAYLLDSCGQARQLVFGGKMKKKSKSERVQSQIIQSIEKFGAEIKGCCGKTPQQSTSTMGGELVLWINTPDHSTHVVRERK